LNELTLGQFQSYLDRYFVDHQYFVQIIDSQNILSKSVSWLASFLPSKVKAALKLLLTRSSSVVRFNGSNFKEFESSYGSLFDRYRIRPIEEYFDTKNDSNGSRYVFIAVCSK